MIILWRSAAIERNRAEAALSDSRRSQAQALRSRAELIGLLMETIPDYSSLSKERTVELMEALVPQTERLCEEPGLTLAEVIQISRLIVTLADISVSIGKSDIASSVLDHGLRLAGAHGHPNLNSPELTVEHQQMLLRIAHYAAETGHYDEARDRIAQAVSLGRNSGDPASCIEALAGAYEECQSIVERALENEDILLATSVSEMFAGMAKSCLNAFPEEPLLHILNSPISRCPRRRTQAETQAPASIGIECSTRSEPWTGIPEPSSESSRFSWLMKRYPSNLRRSTRIPFRLKSAPCGSSSGIDRLSSVDRLPDQIKAACVDRIFVRLVWITTRHRHQRRMDRAESLARTLEILGKQLCASDPDVAAFHIVLAGALEQHYKNAAQAEGDRFGMHLPQSRIHGSHGRTNTESVRPGYPDHGGRAAKEARWMADRVSHR